MEPWVEVLAERLGPPILTTGDEVRFNCFRADCGATKTADTGYHLYLNPTKGKYFCQRCQRGGTLESLAKSLGVEKPGKSLKLWDTLINKFLYGTPETATADAGPVGFPEEYQPMMRGTQAYEYLRSRSISDEQIEFYQIGFGIGELKNRIIFPDVDKQGQVVYWVARTYGHHKAKYKNAKAPREKQVYNLGRILGRSSGKVPRIVVCEGPISAIVAGYDAVATYGKYVTGEQVSRLVEAHAEEYVIAGDGDAVPEAISLATRLYRRGCTVRFVTYENYHDDPASVGHPDIRRKIDLAKRWSDWAELEIMVNT